MDIFRDSKGLWQPVFGGLSTHPRRGSVSVDICSFNSLLPTDQPVNNLTMAGLGRPDKAALRATHPKKNTLAKTGPPQSMRVGAYRRFVGSLTAKHRAGQVNTPHEAGRGC